MKNGVIFLFLTIVLFGTNCSNKKLDEKGFQISQTNDIDETEQAAGLKNDTLCFDTKPSNVLLTGVSNIRIIPIYKVNIKPSDNTTFIGSNSFHYRYEEFEVHNGNVWNNNIMPGFEAVYGYNMVNISHFNIIQNKQKNFFKKAVLIKTLYYPSFSKDTLNNKPVKREYFMVSVYNDDTNNDGYINTKDLRRFYLYNIHGEKQSALIPENYNVFKSEYDSDNDFMYVFAQFDKNKNGQSDEGESIHVFWIDLKDPNKKGRQY